MLAVFALLTKMKRNASNDNEDELKSSCKKLKFGVDTILGNVTTHSDNDPLFETVNHSDDQLKHKVRIHVESPISTSSSVCSSEHSLVQPSHSFYESSQEAHNNQQINLFRQMTAANYSHHSPNPLWRPNFRPFIGNYFENNGTIPGNGFYMPSPMSSLFWSLDLRNKTRPRMLRRAVFSDQQRKGLEVAFLKEKYIGKPERKKLAQRLGLKDSQVKIWFQNRRMKWRNTKERELFTTTNSINNDNNDCYDCQQKEEIISYSPLSPVLDNNNQTNNSHIDKNTRSRRE